MKRQNNTTRLALFVALAGLILWSVQAQAERPGRGGGPGDGQACEKGYGPGENCAPGEGFGPGSDRKFGRGEGRPGRGERGPQAGQRGGIKMLLNDRVSEELGITDEQKETLKKLDSETKEAADAIHKTMQELHEQLREQMQSGEADEDEVMDLVEEIGEKRTEAQKLGISQHFAVQSILTAEQKEKMQENREARQENRSKFREMMKGLSREERRELIQELRESGEMPEGFGPRGGEGRGGNGPNPFGEQADE